MAGKKKKKNEIFNMDDGDTSDVAGGLNDAPEFEETEEEIEFIDHVELDDEPEKDEPVAEVEAKEMPEIQPEVEPEIEPEPEPKPDPAEERFNNMVAMIAKKDEQLQSLVDQVQLLTSKVLTPAQEPEPIEQTAPPEPPDPDEMEWNEYVDAKLKYSDELKAYEKKIKQTEEESIKSAEDAKQAEYLGNIKAIHTKDFAEEAEEMPALKENEIVRNKWAEIYYDPKNSFSTRIDGAIRATRALKALAKKDGVDLYNFGKPKEPAKPDPEKIKADEAARIERVYAGTMTGSKTTDKGVSPSIEHIKAAEKFGVSPEAYMKTFAALGGKI